MADLVIVRYRQPIDTAPRDGTLIDIWTAEDRWTDCYWGHPVHCCGEAGQYCDSEWHGQPAGWVWSTMNAFLPTSDEPKQWAPVSASSCPVSLEEIVGVLEKALPLVEQAEFLENCSYSYGNGGSEPSPAEWGISVGFQQTRDAMPHAQYEAAVELFHRENRDEDEGDGSFLTEANKLRSLLHRLKGGSQWLISQTKGN
jgi:hypothetical protein